MTVALEFFEITAAADVTAAHPVLISMFEPGDDPAATLDQYRLSLKSAQQNGYIFLGCRLDGKLVGVSGIRIMPDPWGAQPYAMLNNLVVLPEYRNQGIGTKLMERSEQLAHERCAFGVGLHVRRDNPAAAKLYESRGYNNRIDLMWQNFKS